MERVPKGVYTKEFKEEAVCIPYGLPLSYYVDSHSIFRFIERRDSFWIKHHVKTDERDPQWKQVLQELRIKVIYALSPQVKGKIERPYRWLQDRIVRTCARENIRTTEQIREVLVYEVKRYNEHQVHSTTGRPRQSDSKEHSVNGRHYSAPLRYRFLIN